MRSYPAKPYVVPHDDWFNNNDSNFEKRPKPKGIKTISTIHEFFYRQSNVKIGGSDNLIQTNLEKKSSKKIIISSFRDSKESFLSRSEEKYGYSKILKEPKLIKRSFQEQKLYRNLSIKKILNFNSYFLNIKSFFIELVTKKKHK